MPEQTHQLVAIMFTDIVGYTVLMGQDSVKALERICISKEIRSFESKRLAIEEGIKKMEEDTL